MPYHHTSSSVALSSRRHVSTISLIFSAFIYYFTFTHFHFSLLLTFALNSQILSRSYRPPTPSFSSLQASPLHTPSHSTNKFPQPICLVPPPPTLLPLPLPPTLTPSLIQTCNYLQISPHHPPVGWASLKTPCLLLPLLSPKSPSNPSRPPLPKWYPRAPLATLSHKINHD